MKHIPTIVAASGLALAAAMGININRAQADAEIASNSQLRGEYAGTGSGGCLISLGGFDQNDRPVDQTRTYSNLFSSEVVFTFNGDGIGNATFSTVTIVVPGPNAVAVPQVVLATGGGNFTYSVGPKRTITVTLTDPIFTNQNGPSAGSSFVIDQIVLNGHFGPNGVTLAQTNGAAETLSPAHFPRTCGRSYVLLGDRQRF